jgi:archaellum component FlaC
VTDDRARLRALAVFLKRRLDEESAERARREQEVEGLRAELRHAEAALQAARAASAAPAAQPLVPPQGQRLAETSLAAFRRDAETRLAEACEATRVQAGLTETARRMVEELSQELEENRRQSAEFEARTALAEGEAERLRQTVEQLRAVRARDRREAEAQHAATLAQSQAGLRKALEELEASEHRRRAEVAAQRDELADVLRRAEAAEAALRELRERADLLETQDLGRRQASDQRALASEGRAAELAAELSRLSAAIEASSRELTDAQEARRADVARLEARAAALAAEHTAALARARAEQDRLHSALTAREADLAQATAALADTRGALSALESRAAEMQNRLGEVEAALRNERLRHQDARHELDQSREAQRADVERLETELATLSSEHAAARTRWQDERGELEAARSAAEQQVAARLAAVSAQLTGAEGSLQGAQDRAAAAELRIAELETRIGELETLLGDAEARASSASEARARAEEQRQRAAREAEEAADHAEGLEQRVAHLLGQVAELERPAVPLAPGRTGLALAGLGTAEAEPAELVLATERRRLEAALAHAQSEADAMLQRITADAAGGTRVETAALLEAVARLRGDVAEAQSRRAVLEGRLVQRLMQAYGRSSEESTEEDGPESIDPGGPRRPRDNAQTEVRTLRADCDALRRHLESEGERARQAELEAAEGRAQAQLSERRHQAEIERLRAALRQAQAATDVSRARGKGLPSQGMVGGPTARIHTLARGQSTIDTPLVPRATREELVRQREALEREQDPDDT